MNCDFWQEIILNAIIIHLDISKLVNFPQFKMKWDLLFMMFILRKKVVTCLLVFRLHATIAYTLTSIEDFKNTNSHEERKELSEP